MKTRTPARPHRLPVLLPLVSPILATALVLACDQRDHASGGGDNTTTVDTVAGVIHVTNTGTPPEWQLTQVVSIGPKSLTEVGSPDEFGGVSAVALGPGGTVFIADARNLEVRVFGLDGAHQRTFGREGEGPGEFEGLYSLAWVGDRLLVLDPALGRISEFSAEGEWLGSRRIRGQLFGSLTTVRFYTVGPDETFRYAQDIRPDAPEGPVFAVAPGDGTIFVGYDSRGETGDTVRWTTGPARPPAVIVCQDEGGMTLFTIPFATEILQHPGPGGVRYTAMTDVYRIAVIRGDADTLRVIGRSLSPEPVTDAEWARELTDYEEFSEERPNASCNPRPSRPETKPLIRALYVAPDGKLWVEVIRSGGNRWEIFDADGRLRGTVPAPPHKEDGVPAFGPDLLVTIRQDSLDLDHVDIWRIERDW